MKSVTFKYFSLLMSEKVYRRHHRHHQRSLRCVFLCDFDSSSSRLLSSVSSTTKPPVCVRAKCIIVERSRMNVMYSQSCSNYTCEHDRYRGRWVMPIISEYCSLKRSEYDRWIGSRFLMHKRRSSSSASTARVWRREVTMKARRSRLRSQFLSFLR